MLSLFWSSKMVTANESENSQLFRLVSVSGPGFWPSSEGEQQQYGARYLKHYSDNMAATKAAKLKIVRHQCHLAQRVNSTATLSGLRLA
jgi:hypothetical protein